MERRSAAFRWVYALQLELMTSNMSMASFFHLGMIVSKPRSPTDQRVFASDITHVTA